MPDGRAPGARGSGRSNGSEEGCGQAPRNRGAGRARSAGGRRRRAHPARAAPRRAGASSCRSAPARSRTWIYRLGGGRLIHWTTRARPLAGGWAEKATGAVAPATGGASAASARELLADQPVGDPLVHRARAEAAVEAEGELVPVERRPFQALAAALAQPGRDRREQRPAGARPCGAPGARRGPRARSPGSPGTSRRSEEERVADRLAVAFGDQRLGRRALAEQGPVEQLLGRAHAGRRAARTRPARGSSSCSSADVRRASPRGPRRRRPRRAHVAVRAVGVDVVDRGQRAVGRPGGGFDRLRRRRRGGRARSRRRRSRRPSSCRAAIAASVEPPVVTTSSTTTQRSASSSSGPSMRRCRPCALASLRTKNALRPRARPAQRRAGDRVGAHRHAADGRRVPLGDLRREQRRRAPRSPRGAGSRAWRRRSTRPRAPLVSVTSPITSACSRSSRDEPLAGVGLQIVRMCVQRRSPALLIYRRRNADP